MTTLNNENHEALEILHRAYLTEREHDALAREEAKEIIEARTHKHRQAVAEAIIAARQTSIPTPWVRIREALGSTHHEVPYRYIQKGEVE